MSLKPGFGIRDSGFGESRCRVRKRFEAPELAARVGLHAHAKLPGLSPSPDGRGVGERVREPSGIPCVQRIAELSEALHREPRSSCSDRTLSPGPLAFASLGLAGLSAATGSRRAAPARSTGRGVNSCTAARARLSGLSPSPGGRGVGVRVREPSGVPCLQRIGEISEALHREPWSACSDRTLSPGPSPTGRGVNSCTAAVFV